MERTDLEIAKLEKASLEIGCLETEDKVGGNDRFRMALLGHRNVEIKCFTSSKLLLCDSLKGKRIGRIYIPSLTESGGQKLPRRILIFLTSVVKLNVKNFWPSRKFALKLQ